jgi:hypothetical protein
LALQWVLDGRNASGAACAARGEKFVAELAGAARRSKTKRMRNGPKDVGAVAI